jgi:tRNA pseudouridine38-40 synthase
VAAIVRRARIVLGYDGSEFVGSQVQSTGRTVQWELERALERLAPGSGRTVFAGRTDRGVHAIGQVVSVDVSWHGTVERLRDALNAILPVDIVVSSVEWTSPTFHARYDARWREYRYRIWIAETPPVLDRRYVWWRFVDLDADLAATAARSLVGTHAFGSFAGSGRSQREEASRLVRTVRACEWRSLWSGGIHHHELRVEANGFLPQMVRNITAALVHVGRGDRPVQWIDDVLAANDRRILTEAAPPQGLVLWRVRYDDEADDSFDGSGSDGEYGIK